LGRGGPRSSYKSRPLRRRVPEGPGPAGPVLRARLGNGLRLLLAPDPRAFTASVWVWYGIGSKNERPGTTGVSHWVEHMMFNGSPRFPKGAMDRAIMEVGGYLNAFTDVDFTAYVSTVPAEHLAIPLAIEADRMTRARMTEAEVERERSIVLSEREGNENWPEFRAEEELYALAFRRHPYRWDPLGYREDIQTMDAGSLAAYYRRFYGTRNALLVVAGQFAPRPLLAEIRHRFGRLPAGGERPPPRTAEPPGAGERRTTLSGPGTTPFVTLGFRAPAATDEAAAATIVLDTLLGGESRMFSPSTWGRSGDHPSARLYRRLVDPGLAVRATSEWRPREDPGLFTVHVQAARGVALDTIEEVLFDELSAVARRGPSVVELREIREKVRAASALAYEGSSRIAFRLGYFELLGPAGYERALYRRVLATRSEEVRRAAGAIFAEANRTVVRFEPTGGSRGG
jgi:zinc protease